MQTVDWARLCGWNLMQLLETGSLALQSKSHFTPSNRQDNFYIRKTEQNKVHNSTYCWFKTEINRGNTLEGTRGNFSLQAAQRKLQMQINVRTATNHRPRRAYVRVAGSQSDATTTVEKARRRRAARSAAETHRAPDTGHRSTDTRSTPESGQRQWDLTTWWW